MTAANPMRGEAPLGEHKLVVDFNGFCSLEGETELKFNELIERLANGLSFSEMRTWVRVFIDADLDNEQAGELIGQLGVEASLRAIDVAVDRFFAKPKKGKAPNPPKAG